MCLAVTYVSVFTFFSVNVKDTRSEPAKRYLFFRKREILLISRSYIKMIQRLKIFPTYVRTSHSLKNIFLGQCQSQWSLMKGFMTLNIINFANIEMREGCSFMGCEIHLAQLPI